MSDHDPASSAPPQLRRSLGLRDLVLYGIIVVQPTAPMPVFGVVSQEARGHVVSAVLLAMIAMLFTAISYGRMARVHPSAGSAFTYVATELHPTLGHLTGWSMALDYVLNPVICTIWCAQAAGNILPAVPYAVWAPLFAVLFTALNLFGIQTSARINAALAAVMGAVIVVFLAVALRRVVSQGLSAADLVRPFYDPQTFSAATLLTGTSVAVLTYIGFDGISTLSEEATNPQRDILRATVLTCAVTGVLAAVEVYVAQLVWTAGEAFPVVDTAFVAVAGRAGGRWLFQLVNATLLVATVGSGMASQLASARLLYGMGRERALPAFFGAVDPRTQIPRNNVLLLGALALVGAFSLSYQLGAELLNFGAFIAFIGVNAAAFRCQVLRDRQRGLGQVAPPLLGAAICLVIWLNLRWPAKVGGALWLLLGLALHLGRRRRRTTR
jgi:putrescine importer